MMAQATDRISHYQRVADLAHDQPARGACTAAFADHVIGERATIADIEQAARRLGRTVSVHRRL